MEPNHFITDSLLVQKKKTTQNRFKNLERISKEITKMREQEEH